jgi:hypothetical protein
MHRPKQNCSCQAASLYSTPTGRKATGFDSTATVYSAGDVRLNGTTTTYTLTTAQSDVPFNRSDFPIIDTVSTHTYYIMLYYYRLALSGTLRS